MPSLPFIDSSSSILNKAYGVCHQAKQTRKSFPISDSRATSRIEIIHCDIWGKNHTHSCGASYFLTLVDDYSRAVWVYLLFDKTEVFKMSSSLFAMIERHFGAKVKIVRSDNGTEFNCMRYYFAPNNMHTYPSIKWESGA